MFRLVCPSSAVPLYWAKVWTDFPVCWLRSFSFFFSFFFPPCGLPWQVTKSLKLVISDSDYHNCSLWLTSRWTHQLCGVCVCVFRRPYQRRNMIVWWASTKKNCSMSKRNMSQYLVFYLWIGMHFYTLRSKNAWCVNQVGGNYRIYRANARRRVVRSEVLDVGNVIYVIYCRYYLFFYCQIMILHI